MNTQTQTTTLAGPLPAMIEALRLAALYVSDDPNKTALHAAQISSDAQQVTILATDGYAAIQYTTEQIQMSGPSTQLPADAIHTALNNATRTIGKRNAERVTATIETVGDTWTVTAQQITMSGTHTTSTPPNVAQFFTTPTEPSETPYTMGAEQLTRLAKTGDAITHTHTNPTKPNHYTTTTKHGHATIIVMPRRP